MYSVDIINTGGYSFRAKSGGYEFFIDSAKGKGVTPPAALLASLGSCIGVYMRKYAEGARLDLGGFDIKVEAEFSKEPPIRFMDINISIDLKGVKMDERRKAALIEFIKNCPVHNTLKNQVNLDKIDLC